MSWKKVSGVLYNKKLSVRVRVKCTRVLLDQPCFMEWTLVAVTERQVGKMEVAELKMVRWALGVARTDKIKNEYVRGTSKIAKLGNKLRNARLHWYGHVKKREESYMEKMMMEMVVAGRRKRGRPGVGGWV